MKQLPLLQPSSLSVSQLTQYLRGLIETDELLRDVWVEGEVSNFSRPGSGHLYFTLKDNGAALRCVIWRSTALRIRFGIQNGLAVEAHGAIGVYDRDGQYQLYIDALRPAGEGLLYQEFMRLKNRLEAEGLFDPERKRPIPERPSSIGIVTSPTGAALQDILNTLRTRYPLATAVIAPCSVQGETAPVEIVNAIRTLVRDAQPNIVLVARGGGSLEDLWAFNDERVVRAIVNCPVPVITGIGHETDFTLADFAADLRAPTPTGAAVQATPDRADLLTELHGLQVRLGNAMTAYTASNQRGLDMLKQRLLHTSPMRRIQNERQQIDDLQQRSTRALQHFLQLRTAHLSGIQNRLEALNPDAILRRGYALVQHTDGALIKSTADVQVGQNVEVRLHDGMFTAQVESVSDPLSE